MKKITLFGCILVATLVVISAFPLAVSEISEGNTIYVDDDGDADYTNIQEAVDAASDGDTIYVYSGTYYEHVKINTSIVLQGEDKETTIIDGDGSGDVVDITADSVNFNGFSVRNGGIWDAGIFVYDSHDTCISDCIVSSNNGHGIELDLTKHASVSDCIISSNKWFGVVIYTSVGNRPQSNNNVVSNCIISNNDEGIFLDDTTGNTIIENSITNNQVYGIHFAFAYDNVIRENNFIENNRNAYFQGSFYNSWSNNYWDNSIKIGMKIILGNVFLLIPWLNFDWNPASEPYDVPITIPSTATQNETIKENNKGKALFSSIYLELDPDSQQVQEIIDNRNSFPGGVLTNIDITVPDPNDEDGEWFMIAPFMRTLIGDWIGIGPFFEIIEPTETTTIHIPLLWGDIHYWPPGSETPEEFIIDGWAPLISWEY